MKKKKALLLSISVVLLLILIATLIIKFSKQNSIDSTIINNDSSEIIFDSSKLPMISCQQEEFEIENEEIIIRKAELEKNFKELFENLIVKIRKRKAYFDLLKRIKNIDDEAIKIGLNLKLLESDILSNYKDLSLLEQKII
ncbi:MAG: hypothetical protein AM1032_000121 [Mycoplasmataceae bacterium]|nr:MAG: hypothetical protein AM1032_000121 [Mycoplasmataceae bacterium]